MFSIPDALYCRCVEAAVFGAVSANACPTALSSVTETAIRVSHFLRCTQPTTPTPIVSRATRRRQRKKEGTCVSVSGDHGSLTVGAARPCPTPVSISASAFATAHSEFESPEKRDIMRCDIFSARDEGEPIVWSTLRHVFGHWARPRASHHELPPRKLEASPPGTDDGGLACHTSVSPSTTASFHSTISTTTTFTHGASFHVGSEAISAGTHGAFEFLIASGIPE